MTRPDTRRCDDLWAWSEYLSPSNPPWRWPLWFPELLYFCFWCNGVCCEYFCFLSVVLVSTPFSFLVGGSVYSCLWYCDSDDEHKVGILSPLNAVFWLIDDQFLLLQQCILKIKILQIMPRCDDGVIRVFVYFFIYGIGRWFSCFILCVEGCVTWRCWFLCIGDFGCDDYTL